MKQYLVIITGDVNDGDYIESHFITDCEGIEKLKKTLETINRLRQSFLDPLIKNDKWASLDYRDNLPYYGEMMEPILQMYEWYFDTQTKYTEWVESIPKEDIKDVLYFYRLLSHFGDEEIHTVISIEVYEITGEKFDLL